MSDQPPSARPGTSPSTSDDFEERLAAALREACKRKWGEGNWEAIQAWNQWVAENDLPLEEYLGLIDRRGRIGS